MLVFVLHLHLQARPVGVYNKRGEQKQGTRQFLYHTHIPVDNVQALSATAHRERMTEIGGQLSEAIKGDAHLSSNTIANCQCQG